MSTIALPGPPPIDGIAALPSLRTLGTGSQQAAAGNDGRFTTPTGAQTTPAAGKVPLAYGSGLIDGGWLSPGLVFGGTSTDGSVSNTAVAGTLTLQNQYSYIALQNQEIDFGYNGSPFAYFNTATHAFNPFTNATGSLGDSSHVWSKLWANDISIGNAGNTNYCNFGRAATADGSFVFNGPTTNNIYYPVWLILHNAGYGEDTAIASPGTGGGIQLTYGFAGAEMTLLASTISRFNSGTYFMDSSGLYPTARSYTLGTSAKQWGALHVAGDTDGAAQGPVYVKSASTSTIGASVTLDATTDATGHSYSFISTGSGAGVGGGHFSIFKTGASYVFDIDNSGNITSGSGTSGTIGTTSIPWAGFIGGYLKDATGDGITLGSGDVFFLSGGAPIAFVNGGGLYPNGGGTYALGTNGYEWNGIYAVNGIHSLNNSAASGSGTGLYLSNATAATGLSQQYSPLIELVSQGWNGLSSVLSSWALQNQAVLGGDPLLNFMYSLNGSAYAVGATLSAAGLYVTSIGHDTSHGAHAVPAVSADVFTLNSATQTLTNKTLTSPSISSPTLSGTLSGTYTVGGTPSVGVSWTPTTDNSFSLGTPSKRWHEAWLSYDGASSASTIGLSTALQLSNDTAATSGVQQYSPLLELVGQGWTGSTSSQQSWGIQTQPVSASNPILNFFYAVGTGSYASAVTFTSSGIATGKIGPNTTQLHTLPAVTSDTVTLLAATQTLTNKSLGSGTTVSANVTTNAFVGPNYGGTSTNVPTVTWTNVTFNSPWSDAGGAYPTTAYFKDATGRVHVRIATSASSASSATIFTLPAGYRPAGQILWAAVQNTGAYMALTITAGGAVTPTTSVSGAFSHELSFMAAA